MFSSPIAHRELLLQAKSPAFYRTRMVTSGILLIIGVGFAVLYHYAGAGAARQAVLLLGYFVGMFGMFAGVASTVDCVAREKRDGTLGLLFLTPLTVPEIVIGKLVANSLGVFYGLLIMLPLFSLAVIVGGIGWREVLGIMAVALNVAFASAAIGLYASSVSVERKRAHARGIWIVLFFWWLLPVAAELAGQHAPPWLGAILRSIAFSSLLGGPPGLVTAGFNPSLGSFASVHLIGWFFIGLAIYYLPRRWQEHPAKPRATLKEWWRNVALGKGKKRLRLRELLLNKNPFFWLASRDRTRRWNAWFSTVFVLGMVLITSGPSRDPIYSCIVAIVLTGLMLQLLWAGGAVAQLLAEQEQGTMEMLLSTPLAPEEIAKGQFMALRRQFGGPIILIFALELVMAIQGYDRDEMFTTLALLTFAGLSLFNLYVLYRLGMWSVCTVRDPKQAAGTAIALGYFVPVGALLGIMGAVALMSWVGGRPIWNPQPGEVFAIGATFQVVSNLFWLSVTHKSLPRKMREWAMQRYQPAPVKRGWAARLIGAREG